MPHAKAVGYLHHDNQQAKRICVGSVQRGVVEAGCNLRSPAAVLVAERRTTRLEYLNIRVGDGQSRLLRHAVIIIQKRAKQDFLRCG